MLLNTFANLFQYLTWFYDTTPTIRSRDVNQKSIFGSFYAAVALKVSELAPHE
jgi:hypothetical protein